MVSHMCFKGYGNLSIPKKVEWNNRGFSTFHAVMVAFASLYLVLLSDLFSEDYNDELIINRTSTVSETLLGVSQCRRIFMRTEITAVAIRGMQQISIGYFLSDLAMILWHFPALGGLEYVLHHGLSMFSIFLALVSGQGQIYILLVLFSEITTPFVNLRWYLDVAGQKSSNIYIWNGVALFLGWLVQSSIPQNLDLFLSCHGLLTSLLPFMLFPNKLNLKEMVSVVQSDSIKTGLARILLFIYFFIHMAIHFDQVKEIFPLGFYSLLTVPPVLGVMNVIWFWKIVRGLIKTLSKARHSQ
ncbi:hypothetical protein Pint_30683 [Pistacia integerrima]|uniref:Uncharacterized protein n=1 Tax=Pistacia integerrima TaxID=434235 RepID=A0ACC0X4D2_9ROSI|nr:hypothetical protein Pint_30683 [Pistacia integerrima]